MKKKTTKKDLTKRQASAFKPVIPTNLTPAELADLITIQQAADLRKVKRASIYELIYRGRLEAIDIAGRKFVRRSDILAFEKERPGPKTDDK